MTYTETIKNLVAEWNQIETSNQWNIWANKIRETKFGTYGTISIFEVIKNVELKFASQWIKDSFLNECNDALNGTNL